MLINNSIYYRQCPLCGSDKIIRVGDIHYPSPLLFSSNVINLKVKPELWKCLGCKSGFTQNAVAEQEAIMLYKSGVGGSRWVSIPLESEKTSSTIRVLYEFFNPGQSILDIGCNTGELLDFAKSRGIITAGVEYSSTSREIADSKGHSCFSSLEETDGRYDLITAFDLVEHLYDVPKFLADCRKKLHPNGILIILTGNFSSLSAKMAGPDWWYLNFPEHIVFPSQHYFYSLAQFSIMKWVSTYAAIKFSAPLIDRAKSLIKGFCSGHYTALPSLVPDHILMVLKNA
ncbi:MAG: class I SAM-dependent methyltransferase [Deltaproteobacteria bacterium]